MSQQSSGPAGPGSDEWPDDLWPSDDNDGAPGGPRPAQSVPPGWPGSGPSGRRLNPTTLAVVVVVAVVAGAGVALGVQFFSGGSPDASPSASQPSALAPVQPGGGSQPGGGGQPAGGGQAGPNGGFPGGSGGTEQAFVIGTVVKVSAASITIGGPGHTITAHVTASTRVSGKVSAISELKAGDQVSVQISESNGTATAMAIHYPAQLPSGGVPGG